MKLFSFLPALGWAIVVLIAISLPGSHIPVSGLLKLPYFDKLVHLVLFLVLAVLLAYGFYRQETHTTFHRYHMWLTLFFGIIYGMLTELLQYWLISERHGTVGDFAANAVGTVFGVMLFSVLPVTRLKKPE